MMDYFERWQRTILLALVIMAAVLVVRCLVIAVRWLLGW